MSVPACLQSFCIFGLKCSVVNPEVGNGEEAGSQLWFSCLEVEKRHSHIAASPQVFMFHRIYLSDIVLSE